MKISKADLVEVKISDLKVNDLVYLSRDGVGNGGHIEGLALARVTTEYNPKDVEIGVTMLENYYSRDFPANRKDLIYCHDEDIFYKAIEINPNDLEEDDIVYLESGHEPSGVRVIISYIDKDYYNSDFQRAERVENPGSTAYDSKIEIEVDALDRAEFGLGLVAKNTTFYEYIDDGSKYNAKFYKLVDTNKKTMFKKQQIE